MSAAAVSFKAAIPAWLIINVQFVGYTSPLLVHRIDFNGNHNVKDSNGSQQQRTPTAYFGGCQQLEEVKRQLYTGWLYAAGVGKCYRSSPECTSVIGQAKDETELSRMLHS